jgi:hypothetical protein
VRDCTFLLSLKRSLTYFGINYLISTLVYFLFFPDSVPDLIPEADSIGVVMNELNGGGGDLDIEESGAMNEAVQIKSSSQEDDRHTLCSEPSQPLPVHTDVGTVQNDTDDSRQTEGGEKPEVQGKKCLFCTKTFALEETLKTHLVRVHAVKVKMNSCTSCDHIARTFKELILHYREVHGVNRDDRCQI